MKFEQALKDWKEKEAAYRAAKLAYETTYAKALLASAASSADKREAEADIASAAERIVFDKTEVEARAAEHLMMHLRNPEAA